MQTTRLTGGYDLELDLNDLLFDIRKLLTDDFLFVCVNTYTANLSLLTLECLLKVVFKNNKIRVFGGGLSFLAFLSCFAVGFSNWAHINIRDDNSKLNVDIGKDYYVKKAKFFSPFSNYYYYLFILLSVCYVYFCSFVVL